MRRPALLLCALAAAGCGAEDVTRAAREAVAAEPLRGRVLRVVDGDTLHVRVGPRREKVRLIGVDAPETFGDRECGGRAATRAMRRLVDGRHVALVPDPTQDRRDRYGRLLAYVDLPGGRDAGEKLIAQGWAQAFVFERPFTRLRAYRRAQEEARDGGRGAWSRCAQ